jgi:mono/diheme cytochrome c family protein
MTRLIRLIALTLVIGAPGAAALAADGEKVFLFYCAQCHGTGGKGDGPNVTKFLPVSPRDFTDAKETNKMTDDHIKKVIVDGGPAVSKSSMMPAWADTLNDDEVQALLDYIHELCDCPGKQE